MERFQQRHDLKPGHGAAQHPVQEVPGQLQGVTFPLSVCVTRLDLRVSILFKRIDNQLKRRAKSKVRTSSHPTTTTNNTHPQLRTQHIDGINLFGLISIVSLLYCAPAAVYVEGSQWLPAWNAAVEKVGKTKMLQLLAMSGVFYHLYNQVCVCVYIYIYIYIHVCMYGGGRRVLPLV